MSHLLGRQGVRLLVVAPLLALSAISGCESGDGPLADPDAQFQAAVASLRAGDDLENVGIVARQLVLTPGYEQHGQLLQAGLQLRAHDHIRALRGLQQLQPQGELTAPARLWTAEALYRTGLLADAKECIAPLADDPDYAADAHRWLAAISYDVGANKESLGHLQELVRLTPDDYRPHTLAARMYLDFSQHEAAQHHFESALELSPPASEHQGLSIGLARTLIAQRNYAAALEALRKASSDATVLALQSRCYRQLAEDGPSRETLAAALRLGPDNLDVLSQYADQLLSDQKPAEAADVLKKLIAKKPFDHDARYRLSLAYRQSGRTEEAEKEMAQVTTLRTQYDRLSELNNQAIQSPHDAAVRLELAELCEQLGRPQMAAVWRQAAAAVQPFPASPVPETAPEGAP